MHQGIEYDDDRGKHKLLRLLLILSGISALGISALLCLSISNGSFVSNGPDIQDNSTSNQVASAASTSLNGTRATSSSPTLLSSDSPLSSRVGISLGDTLPFLSSAELDKRLDDMASLGVGWIRIDMAWDDIQPKNSATFNWTNLDRVVAAANARHIQILPVLAYTPAWARPSTCSWSDKCAPADPNAFAAFAKAAVARYGPQGVSAWEIWNEPNTSGFWKPSPNPVAYTTLLKLTYAAIKAAEPSATVITGGLAPASNTTNRIAPLTFLQDIYTDDAQGYFDAVGFHPYTYPSSPSDFAQSNAWSQMASTSPSLRSIMVANGDSSKQIWMTEYGAPTGGPGTAAGTDNYKNGGFDHVTDALQAALITDAISSIQNVHWAGPLFIYSYEDLGTSSDTVENFFGLLWYDGSQKPSYAALKEALMSND